MQFGHLLLVARVDMEAVKLAVVFCPSGCFAIWVYREFGVFRDVRDLKKGERMSTITTWLIAIFSFASICEF